jgi:hypothetical protein
MKKRKHKVSKMQKEELGVVQVLKNSLKKVLRKF